MAESAAQKQTALQEELTALEEKQFAGLDIPAMREQLVDLSARYEEALRDSSGGEEQDWLSELRAKSPKDRRSSTSPSTPSLWRRLPPR